MLFHDGRQIKYGQIEILFSYKESIEWENDNYLAFVNEFALTGKILLQDVYTGGACFHVVSLLEMPAKKTIVAL